MIGFEIIAVKGWRRWRKERPQWNETDNVHLLEGDSDQRVSHQRKKSCSSSSSSLSRSSEKKSSSITCKSYLSAVWADDRCSHCSDGCLWTTRLRQCREGFANDEGWTRMTAVEWKFRSKTIGSTCCYYRRDRSLSQSFPMDFRRTDHWYRWVTKSRDKKTTQINR